MRVIWENPSGKGQIKTTTLKSCLAATCAVKSSSDDLLAVPTESEGMADFREVISFLQLACKVRVDWRTGQRLCRLE